VAYAAPYNVEPKTHNLLGQNRILVICEPDNNAPESKQSVSVDRDGFEDRDLIIIKIGKGKSHRLARIARCENKLEYVLIGKDTTQKQRWDLFPSNDELYSLIDAMPMRRYEMRQRAGKN